MNVVMYLYSTILLNTGNFLAAYGTVSFSGKFCSMDLVCQSVN